MFMFFYESDDEVEVGADLYEIDSEAEATVQAADPAAQSAAPVSASVPEPEPEPTPTESIKPADTTATKAASARVPSIKFLGKEGWKTALTAMPEYVIPADYGRLDFSEEEIEALLSGGASLAPEIEEYSTGAVFSV